MTTTERIDRYLSGLMDAAELKAFEAELVSDESLARELQLQKDMLRVVSSADRRRALKGQLADLGNRYFSEETQAPGGEVVPMKPRRYLRLLAAAAAVLLLIVAYFALRPSLYDQFAKHPPLALVEKSGAAADGLSAAEEAFNQGHYRRAIPPLEDYLAANPNDDLVRIYLGIANMEIGDLATAQSLFQDLRQGDAALEDFARWNLALSFLKEGDKSGCREVLEAIPDQSVYALQARELLERLGGR